MPTGNRELGARGRSEWVAPVFAAVEVDPGNGLDTYLT
jgi:hypothetical protein